MAEPECKRAPIVVGEHAIALLTLFKLPYDHLDDAWAWDWIREETATKHLRSAKTFIDALEGHWSPAFLMALRTEITLKLQEHDTKYGTEFARRGEETPTTADKE